MQGHRTPYCPWVIWNLGGRARPRNSFARFPPCFKNTSRGALRLSSKRSSRKRGRRARSRRSGERSEAQRLPYARSGTQMGNKERTKNVRIYGEHGVCNTLCLFIYPLLRRSYRICFSFYSKQKTVSGANRTSRERNEHLIMGERKINKQRPE